MAIDMNMDAEMTEYFEDYMGRTWTVLRIGRAKLPALYAKEIKEHIGLGANAYRVEATGGTCYKVGTKHCNAFLTLDLLVWADAHRRATDKKAQLELVIYGIHDLDRERAAAVIAEQEARKNRVFYTNEHGQSSHDAESVPRIVKALPAPDVEPDPIPEPPAEIAKQDSSQDIDDFNEDEGFRTIEWTSFVYDDGKVKGISLRALVEAGLYSDMSPAWKSLKESGMPFSIVRSTSDAGRHMKNYVLGLRDAQRFASRTRTDVGLQILDLILDHHDDFQKLLAGDEEVRARVDKHAAKPEPIRTSIEDMLGKDPLEIVLMTLLERQREARENRQALELVQAGQAEQGAKLARMEAEHQRRNDALARAFAAPHQDEPVTSDKDYSSQTNDLLRDYVRAGGSKDYGEACRQVYGKLYQRFVHDVERETGEPIQLGVRAKNMKKRGERASDFSGIKLALELGHAKLLYTTALSLFSPDGAFYEAPSQEDA